MYPDPEYTGVFKTVSRFSPEIILPAMTLDMNKLNANKKFVYIMKNERNSSNILLFIGVFGARCDQTDWILHFFFISNFFPNECMPWMWYLSLDMQLHLVTL